MTESYNFPRAYELHLQKAREVNDIGFLVRDIDLRKWAFEATGDVHEAKQAYEFVTGYQKAPEPAGDQEPLHSEDVSN